MKKISIIYAITGLFALIFNSCTLHQEPDGFGEDPTEVLISADVNISLKLPQREDAVTTAARAATGYSHRFVIEALGDDERVHDRREFIVPIEEGAETVMLPVNMRLHARNYRILVWSDYVNITESETVTFYNATSLTPVMPNNGYRANTEYKDAFSACGELDLRPYKDQWQSKFNVTLDLSRPVGRYELISTDVAAFQRKLNDGTIKGGAFTARLRYGGYVATGFNVAEQTPKNMLSFLSYNTSLNNLSTTENKVLRIGFDFIICQPDLTEIPVEIEIVNEKNEVVSNTAVNIPLQAGYNTTVKGRFLTATTDGGLNIDPDYDGTVDVDLGKL